ncbi:hypothetical protein [Desulforamulus ferrireducens]|uniref:Uncharacterized protein n=1 Tax=Desulforamulus ferrireducens TaxID=1833852 RepID=A0A1S6IZ26_9FIRM|nr:hypothetical protein [Desulforamulus ferrireducens]AQS60022.1 hypothetical protein B0537_13640 [Desulforamulus ferrireducens]
MRTCPYASGSSGCNALRSAGFASNTVTIPETWRNKFCTSGYYSNCPNMKAAQEIRDERRKGKGGRLGDKVSSTSSNSSPASQPIRSPNQPIKKGKTERPNPVHAHGGKVPHFCEKPWRSFSLRFRVIKSLFYLKPWK